MPAYSLVEKGVSSAVRKAAREFNGEVVGRFAAEWIRHSRDEIMRSGTNPLPKELKEMLYPHYGKELVDNTKYSVGGHGFFNTASSAFNIKNKAAVVLNDVIVLKNKETIYNAWLMAHEFHHVKQYNSISLLGVAKRYVKDYASLEREADLWADKVVGLKLPPSGEVVFSSSHATALLEEGGIDLPVISKSILPADIALSCKLYSDGSEYVFGFKGDGFPGGKLSRSPNKNCYVNIHALGPSALCVSYDGGKLINSGGNKVGQCEYYGDGNFVRTNTRFFGSYSYTLNTRGQQPSVEFVSVSKRNYHQASHLEFDRYSYSTPDGRYTYYFAEVINDGLYMYFSDEWDQDIKPLKIISYWGNRSVNTQAIQSQYQGEQVKNTPAGQFRCKQYHIIFKERGGQLSTCITPSVGEVWRLVVSGSSRSELFLKTAS